MHTDAHVIYYTAEKIMKIITMMMMVNQISKALPFADY